MEEKKKKLRLDKIGRTKMLAGMTTFQKLFYMGGQVVGRLEKNETVMGEGYDELQILCRVLSYLPLNNGLALRRVNKLFEYLTIRFYCRSRDVRAMGKEFFRRKYSNSEKLLLLRSEKVCIKFLSEKVFEKFEFLYLATQFGKFKIFEYIFHSFAKTLYCNQQWFNSFINILMKSFAVCEDQKQYSKTRSYFDILNHVLSYFGVQEKRNKYKINIKSGFNEYHLRVLMGSYSFALRDDIFMHFLKKYNYSHNTDKLKYMFSCFRRTDNINVIRPFLRLIGSVNIDSINCSGGSSGLPNTIRRYVRNLFYRYKVSRNSREIITLLISNQKFHSMLSYYAIEYNLIEVITKLVDFYPTLDKFEDSIGEKKYFLLVAKMLRAKSKKRK